MKKLLYNINGGALIIVLGVMLMLTIAAIMAVHTAQTDIDLSFNQVDHDHAFYVADAGLKKAFNELNGNNLWEEGYADVTFEDGTYWVVATRDIPVTDSAFSAINDTVWLRSTGVARDAESNVRAVVVPELFYPFRFALFGDDFIDMNNASATDSYNSDSSTYDPLTAGTEGDVASNGTITLINAASIGGDATSSLVGGVSVCATCTVADNINTGVDPVELEEIPEEQFDWALANNDNSTGLTGSYDSLTAFYDLWLGTADTALLASGTYYFDDVTLGSNSCLRLQPDAQVTIYLRGTLTLNNNTSVNPFLDPTNLLIISDGQVVAIGNDTEIHAAFYGPDASVTLGQSCDWFGSLIAESVTMSNTGSLHYDEALAPIPVTTTGRMMMIAWEEE